MLVYVAFLHTMPTAASNPSLCLQDLPFFDRLSPGELMARTSGDSLTVRSIVSSTSYQVYTIETVLKDVSCFFCSRVVSVFL